MELSKKIVDLLKQKKYTITTAESCTGGMIASTLIDVSGVSDVLGECYVTYSNEAKTKCVGVSKDTIDNYGVVSKETAYEMAKGAAKTANAEVALATTGLAGPLGETKDKPVGLVYIACSVNDNVIVEKHIFKGDRSSIRKQATKRALELAIECLE